MFKGKSTAEFNVDGHQAIFMIDNDMPVVAVQAVLNKLTHFCVERVKEVENEIEQQKKDEAALNEQSGLLKNELENKEHAEKSLADLEEIEELTPVS